MILKFDFTKIIFKRFYYETFEIYLLAILNFEIEIQFLNDFAQLCFPYIVFFTLLRIPVNHKTVGLNVLFNLYEYLAYLLRQNATGASINSPLNRKGKIY